MDEGLNKLMAAAGQARLACCDAPDPEPMIMRMNSSVFISGECRNCEQPFKVKIPAKKFDELNGD